MNVCNFLRFKRRDGTYTSWLAQNYFIGQTITYNDLQYPHLAVGVATNSSTRGGDRSEAAIGAGISALSLNVFAEAARERWLLEVKTVTVNRVDQSLGPMLTLEYWAALKVQHDAKEPVVALQLASPLDAVRAPGGRVLSQRLVGALPTNGNLTMQ
jgi:hypothetical protein